MDEKKSPFVAIVGCPRSGTYLLAHHLNSRFSVALPAETHFIPLFERVLWLWGDLSRPVNRARLLDAIFWFQEIWHKYSEPERSSDQVRRFSLLSVGDERGRIHRQSGSYPDLVAGLFHAYARSMGAEAAGDKSAFYAHVSLDRLQASVPSLKVIHVIRDGRDVCLSWRQIWTGPTSLTAAALLWKRHVRAKRAWGRQHPDSYLEVRYEDFLANPESVFQKIGVFTGLSLRDQTDVHQDAADYAEMVASSTTHRLVGQPLDVNNVNKWQSRMSKPEVRLFETMAGDTLKELGYPCSGCAPLPWKKFRMGCAKIYEAANRLFWMRMVKNWLPVVLRIAQALRLDRLAGRDHSQIVREADSLHEKHISIQ